MNRTGCVGTWNDEGEWAMEDVRGEEADPPNPDGLCPLPEKVRGSIFYRGGEMVGCINTL
jgi:hypothetical protein